MKSMKEMKNKKEWFRNKEIFENGKYLHEGKNLDSWTVVTGLDYTLHKIYIWNIAKCACEHCNRPRYSMATNYDISETSISKIFCCHIRTPWLPKKLYLNWYTFSKFLNFRNDDSQLMTKNRAVNANSRRQLINWLVSRRLRRISLKPQ